MGVPHTLPPRAGSGTFISLGPHQLAALVIGQGPWTEAELRGQVSLRALEDFPLQLSGETLPDAGPAPGVCVEGGWAGSQR